MNNPPADDTFYERSSSSYNEEVTHYVTQRVMGELFTTLQTSHYPISDFYQFRAVTEGRFRDVRNHTFPRGEVSPDPFAPNYPPRNPLETRVRVPVTQRNRCASATITGFRCTYHILYPLSACAVHAQYFTTHLCLPPGGSPHPHTHNKRYIGENALIDLPTPEMRRVPTTQSLKLIQKANDLSPPPNTLMRPPTHPQTSLITETVNLKKGTRGEK